MARKSKTGKASEADMSKSGIGKMGKAKAGKKPARQPGPSGPVVTVEVENPDWRPARDGERAFPRLIAAQKNIRESAVETLFARGFLARAQKEAADRFRACWEKAGGTVRSLDHTLDRVDGGRGDPLAARIAAAHELKRCRQLIGHRGYQVLQLVCAEGRALAEITPHKRERLTMADNLRADLDDIAAMWGIQTARRRVGGEGVSVGSDVP
ncbi:hypothetical protein [Aminobacter sp. MDW-2]|uniref:hypothetical protein n=1 Tax=Aminobacter sp. MDW-2 TaxID=2666139 RepID=UPI0012B0B0A9|nr:hypothetical protein [Aminobacter sp. MDW-2]MRX37148.1 hypothetical protein [Aminobacter sp. MDW-2]QNH33301.1 hypothetical protein H5P29_22740 [Aminobacter sp. MDW-2]